MWNYCQRLGKYHKACFPHNRSIFPAIVSGRTVERDESVHFSFWWLANGSRGCGCNIIFEVGLVGLNTDKAGALPKTNERREINMKLRKQISYGHQFKVWFKTWHVTPSQQRLTARFVGLQMRAWVHRTANTADRSFQWRHVIDMSAIKITVSKHLKESTLGNAKNASCAALQ